MQCLFVRQPDIILLLFICKTFVLFVCKTFEKMLKMIRKDYIRRARTTFLRIKCKTQILPLDRQCSYRKSFSFTDLNMSLSFSQVVFTCMIYTQCRYTMKLVSNLTLTLIIGLAPTLAANPNQAGLGVNLKANLIKLVRVIQYSAGQTVI